MTGTTASLLQWWNIVKLVVGFGASLLLLWAKNESDQRRRVNTLKSSAWNVAKHHTDLGDLITDLDQVAAYAKQGKVWISAIDPSECYTAVVGELACSRRPCLTTALRSAPRSTRNAWR